MEVPFSLGTIPHFDTDLEFDTESNVAAIITSPAQPSFASNSPNQSTAAEAVVVSILKRSDRLKALEACLDEKSLVNVRVDGQESRRVYEEMMRLTRGFQYRDVCTWAW